MLRKRDKLDQLYSSKRWRIVRLQVLKRDLFLCQRCKQQEGNIVHHIIPLRADLTKAYELSNLETVCASCHSQLHPERNAKIDYKKRSTKIDIVMFHKNKE
ncbi:TPA: HNH endonuclease [Listeria monocytogenes]|nr:HNH endonuclease [Listeria monocytogenes]EAG4634091.1 HNH endonuclease [Listeria monocytogenes]EFS8542086.1 HNH endonuclease [Listeria monocytogenes]EHP2905778.1 HNH endonuclease [Listeria monocytogenes]EHP2950374.1 HNH endonuclease [Listeria monocytogenes]